MLHALKNESSCCGVAKSKNPSKQMEGRLNHFKCPQNQNRTAFFAHDSQPAFTCSKLTTETLEQGAKYVQSQQ